jgi:hypothetical protein
VIRFYGYFSLYSGNLNFLAGGVWQEQHQLTTLMQPGFWLGQAIAIPKLIAAPLMLFISATITYGLGCWVERMSQRTNQKSPKPLPPEHLQSRIFALATFIAFNFLFFLGVQPTLGYFPGWAQTLISWVAVVSISFWLFKVWHRNQQQYVRERDADLFLRQLERINIDFSAYLEGRALSDLNPDELYALAKATPAFSKELYTGILVDAIAEHRVQGETTLQFFQTLRQNLNISETDHWQIYRQIEPDLPQAEPEKTLPKHGTYGNTVMKPIPRSNRSDLPNHKTIISPRRDRK